MVGMRGRRVLFLAALLVFAYLISAIPVVVAESGQIVVSFEAALHGIEWSDGNLNLGLWVEEVNGAYRLWFRVLAYKDLEAVTLQLLDRTESLPEGVARNPYHAKRIGQGSVDVKFWYPISQDAFPVIVFITYRVAWTSYIGPFTFYVSMALAAVSTLHEGIKRYGGRAAKGLVPLIAPLYFMLVGEEVLEHPVRKDIYWMIERLRICTAADVKDTLGISATVASWHLWMLESRGFIESTRVAGRIVYHSPKISGNAAASLFLLRNPTRKKIVEFLMDEGPSHIRGIARALSLSTETVKRNVDILVRYGVLVEKRSRDARIVSVNEEFLERLRSMEEA